MRHRPLHALVAVLLSGMRKAELDESFVHLEQRAQLARHVSERPFFGARAKLPAIPALNAWLVQQADACGFERSWGQCRQWGCRYRPRLAQDYDAANNVIWRASGNALPATTSCDTGSVASARKVTFGYDTLNRLTSTSYADGSPAITRSYTNDGLPATVTSNGAVWTNSYNNRRQNWLESLSYGGATYNITRSYDANGSLASLTYPVDGLTVAYSPNALGQPTQVGSYASGITYHPNGAIAGFT